VRAAVVGGGLAGLAAAIELADAGHEVTLYEARPTLGGKVQTLPRREGDPEPPPDNGQHVALGCFTEYLGFLDRVGSLPAVRRGPLALPVIDERGRVATISPGLRSLLAYGHLPFGDRLRIARLLARLPEPRFEETFGDFLRRHGQSDAAVARFWDVFVRPALNLRADEVDAGAAVFTVRTGLLAGRGSSDLVLPLAPLGEVHGEAAERALLAAGASIRLGERVDDLGTLDAEAVVVALPPEESARLLGEPEPGLEHSPIVSIHLHVDRPILRHELAALLGSDAHWVFDRGRLTGRMPERGQYLTVVSSGAPELMELRGRELVERIVGQLTARLGRAELLWSRISREPEATLAQRPGTRRPPAGEVRPGVARAGAWTDGWPVTMENAVRSGRAAARAVLSGSTTTVIAA
jgi:squalene-associated FAD-dependent desaturase